MKNTLLSLSLIVGIFISTIQKVEAYVEPEKFCYATLTFENDLYVPGVAGFSVYFEYVELETWQIKKVSLSALDCSGRYAFNFVYLSDIRGINYEGDALFLLKDGILKLVPFVGPVNPTGY